MKLISWNVNGIRSIHRKGKLVPFLEEIQPDIACFQETKAEEHQSEVDLPDYEEYWNSSSERRGYAGTAIFTKIKPLKIIQGFPDEILQRYDKLADNYGNPNKEGRLITAEYERFFVVNVYTPNAKRDLSRLELRHKYWDPAFLCMCETLEKDKPVILCGDFNVAHTPDDLANPETNEGEHGFTKEEREGIDKLLKSGFVDTFRMFHRGNGYYTWWSNFSGARERNKGWRIDYFFVSHSLTERVRISSIHPDILGSDHCPISLEIDM